MEDKCRECENETLLKCADLELRLEKAERYNKLLERCLDVKDELCSALREDNEELRTKLKIYKEEGEF